MEFFGKLNLLKGGIVYSDAINTVSKGYAAEIQTEEYGFGLDGLLRSRADVLTGIVNGVDYEEWSPEKDRYIAAPYATEDVRAKQVCKRDLLQTFGLPAKDLKRPVIGIVSRFATQKGFDLIEEIAQELAAEDVVLTAIGTGEPQYEEMFRTLAAQYPEKIAVRVTYSDELAHKIEAGADMFLMPSRYEPCGLNQIYSLRYGTIPIVRATGGLDDTINERNGFKFREYSGPALLAAIRSALRAYQNPARWQELISNAMHCDFSWNASAAEYSALYRRIAG
jgi:starch synthase